MSLLAVRTCIGTTEGNGSVGSVQLRRIDNRNTCVNGAGGNRLSDVGGPAALRATSSSEAAVDFRRPYKPPGLAVHQDARRTIAMRNVCQVVGERFGRTPTAGVAAACAAEAPSLFERRASPTMPDAPGCARPASVLESSPASSGVRM